MKVTLTHDGKSVELDLTNEQLTALGLKEEKKTGYEKDKIYCYVTSDNSVVCIPDSGIPMDLNHHNHANYYTSRKVAEANARADLLMRRLRRFAAENGGIPNVEDWTKEVAVEKHFIQYDHANHRLRGEKNWQVSLAGVVFFLSQEARDKAMEIFHDELIWYFTEYEAMLR